MVLELILDLGVGFVPFGFDVCPFGSAILWYTTRTRGVCYIPHQIREKVSDTRTPLNLIDVF